MRLLPPSRRRCCWHSPAQLPRRPSRRRSPNAPSKSGLPLTDAQQAMELPHLALSLAVDPAKKRISARRATACARGRRSTQAQFDLDPRFRITQVSVGGTALAENGVAERRRLADDRSAGSARRRQRGRHRDRLFGQAVRRRARAVGWRVCVERDRRGPAVDRERGRRARAATCSGRASTIR